MTQKFWDDMPPWWFVVGSLVFFLWVIYALATKNDKK